MEIVKIEMNLKAVNKSIALFNCEKKVSGVIHSNSTGETTVISTVDMYSESSTVLIVL